MFELVAGSGSKIPTYKRLRSFLTSVVGHSVLVIGFLLVPLLSATDQLPEVPTMLAFVAMSPSPAPPPPPPPAPAATSAKAAKRVEELTDSEFAAPIEIPDEIMPESGLAAGIAGGMPGGVEGGVPGGVMGGVLGGLPSEVPPPPPAPKQVEAVRVGGAIEQPALVQRVPPVYPEVALLAQLQGLVILEATVNTDGQVEAVKVLRSVGLLDEAAIDAVRQWRYSPLTLNGVPTPFILTVTVAFELDG